jgi:glycosyltransferase involved in cell wall biosynthesis
VKRVLFVSRQFPEDIARSVHGVYLRMRLFLDALSELAESIEMLFYVEEGVDASPAAMRRAEENLCHAWGVRAQVTLCSVAGSPAATFWTHYLKPSTNMFVQASYAGTSGRLQVAAFEAALERHPDAVFVHRLDAMCPALLTRRSLPPAFLDLVEHVLWLREVRQPPLWPARRPERIPSFASHPPGVEFTGFVDDLDQLYRRVRIVCCPILAGGGTRVKILEAAAHGEAIVSTVVGAEGLEMRDGVDIVLRDGPAAFARACIELLQDPARCKALGASAREVVARRYDRRQIVNPIKGEIGNPGRRGG